MAKSTEKNQYWIHRITGGDNGQLLSYPILRNHNLISIGWSFISTDVNAKAIQTRGMAAIKEAYAAAGVEPKKNTYSLLNFIKKMHEGDIVVVPNGGLISIYRLTDDVIISNESIPNAYLKEENIILNQEGLSTIDNRYVDVGFYRSAEPLVIDLPRNQADAKLQRRMRTLSTNVSASDIVDSIDSLITKFGKRKAKKGRLKFNVNSGYLADIHIINYKNINNLRIENLHRINLFVGANNTGKSNILEAISLYASNFNYMQMVGILKERHEDVEYFEENRIFGEQDLISAFSPFFPSRNINRLADGENIILGSGNKYIQLALKTAIYREERGIRRMARLSNYGKTTQNQGISNLRETVLVALPSIDEVPLNQPQTKDFENILQIIRLGNHGLEYQSAVLQNSMPYKYINCKRRENNDIENYWAHISMTGREDTILNALRIADSRIQKFNFVKVNSHTYLPMVLLEGTQNKQPLTEMGDGMTHILNIIMTLIECQNGILLLDEIDSGLHYLKHKQLWEVILKTSEELNVQIFATSHSTDCMRAMAEACMEDGRQNGMLFALDYQNGNNQIYTYSTLQLVDGFIKGDAIPPVD